MSLVKTKRDAALAGPSPVAGAGAGVDDLLARQGVEETFRSLEARLRGEVAEQYPSRWVDVAGYELPDQRWIVHGQDLLLRNTASAGPGFDGARASSLLVDLAGDHRFDPVGSGERFTYEILALSGWLENALPAALPLPEGAALTRLAELYRAPASAGFDPEALTSAVLPALTERLTAERVRWEAGTLEMEDPLWMERLARTLQSFVRDESGLFAVARADGPLHDGFAYGEEVTGGSARPDDVTTRLAFLRHQVRLIGRDPSGETALAAAGYDHTRAGNREELDDLLRSWLTGDRELAGLVGESLPRTPAHRDGHTGWIYIPDLLPGPAWGPRESWRPWLCRTMLHELLHRLAHPAYVAGTDRVADPFMLREGVVDLLTAEFLTLARSHAELGALVPGDVPADYGAAGPGASEIQGLTGPDHVKAAFFLGRTEFIGLP